MQPSSTMCRAQEARQHLLATNSSLPNVKQVALLAAAAWAKEASAAEKREERSLRRQSELAGARLELPVMEDRLFSENPDRGHSDPDEEAADRA